MRFIAVLLVLLFESAHSSDDFVLLWGGWVQSDIDIEGETICIDGSNYTVRREPGGSSPYKVSIERPGSWNRIGYIGSCSDKKVIKADEVTLSNNSPESLEFRRRGIEEFSSIGVPKYYDGNLDLFYEEVMGSDAILDFNTVVRKWPMNDQEFLLEQCFQATAIADSYPSHGEIPVVYAEKYQQLIVSGGYARTISESEIEYIVSHCECDTPTDRPCQMIDRMEDLNGNGRYGYTSKFQQPEGAQYEIFEYNGNSIEVIHRICTGEMAVPYGSQKCP